MKLELGKTYRARNGRLVKMNDPYDRFRGDNRVSYYRDGSAVGYGGMKSGHDLIEEVVEAPAPKLKIGKTYRTRSGIHVNITHENDYGHRFHGNNGLLYTRFGKLYGNVDWPGAQSALDLVEEVVEPETKTDWGYHPRLPAAFGYLPGDVFPIFLRDDGATFVAGIIVHGLAHQIKCYGSTEEHATALRDYTLAALWAHQASHSQCSHGMHAWKYSYFIPDEDDGPGYDEQECVHCGKREPING